MKLEDLPSEDLRWIAEVIGVQNAVKLAMEIPGINLYISKKTKRDLQRAYVRRVANSDNIKSLARAMGYSTRTLYQWISEDDIAGRKVVQGTLF